MAYEEIITSSKTAVEGGAELSLVTTGEKYQWSKVTAEALLEVIEPVNQTDLRSLFQN